MNIEELITALSRLGIAELRDNRAAPDGEYRLEGRLPEYPFGGRLTAYNLRVNRQDGFVGTDEIEALLRHFWQGQVELSELRQASTTAESMSVGSPTEEQSADKPHFAWSVANLDCKANAFCPAPRVVAMSLSNSIESDS